jgi:type II secretion system protein N
MALTKKQLWKRIAGYASFATFALFVSFFLTFPYGTVQEVVQSHAERAGFTVRIGSLGPGFMGIRARDVQIARAVVGDEPSESVKIDSIRVGPSLFPPGVSVSVDALGGTLAVQVSGVSTLRVKVDADALDLSKGNLKGYSGIDLAGLVGAHADVSVPKATGAGAEPDLSQASGVISLETRNLAINGGTATLTIPQFGPEPTPLDLPKIVFGDITGKVKLDKGATSIDEFRSKSADLEATVSGTLKLAKRLEYSESTLEVRLKPDPEFQKRLGLIGSALSMLGSDPKDPSWRLGRLTGYLGRPQFR